MKARVIRQFLDKNTKRIRQEGMVFELTQERFDEIQATAAAYGFPLIEEVKEQKKAEPEKTEEVKAEEPKPKKSKKTKSKG